MIDIFSRVSTNLTEQISRRFQDGFQENPAGGSYKFKEISRRVFKFQ